MLTTIISIWLVAALASLAGYHASRWRRGAGALFLLTLVAIVVWYGVALADPYAMLIVLAAGSGSGAVLGSLAAGLLLAMAATTVPLVRRARGGAAA